MDSSWIVIEILCSRRTQHLIFVFKKQPVDLELHQSSSAKLFLFVLSSSIGYHRLSGVAVLKFKASDGGSGQSNTDEDLSTFRQ
jgi:hypothetical protein